MKETKLLTELIKIQNSEPLSFSLYIRKKYPAYEKSVKRWCIYFRQICLSNQSCYF